MSSRDRAIHPLFLGWLGSLLVAGTSSAQTESEAEPAPPTWTWQGYEVMGYRTVTREQILAEPPVELGTPCDLRAQLPSLRAWGARLKQRLDLYEVRCSAVRYVGFAAYVLVDVIEKGDEHRVRYRPRPDGDVELWTVEIRDAYERLEKRARSLFEKGTPSREFADAGYLDYEDSEMHACVEELRELVPARRDRLIEVIASCRDDGKRGDAARLLNWAGEPAESIARVHVYLDDPSGLVRNNIARFMLHYVQGVESSEVRQAMIEGLAKTVDRPAHGDRNKGLYGLLYLAETFPEDRARIEAKAGELIERIAERSILGNVRDPARELVELLRDD